MPYNRYELKHSSDCLVLYKILAGIVDRDISFKR